MQVVAEHAPLVTQVVVGADQVFAARIGIGDLRGEVEALVGRAELFGCGNQFKIATPGA